MTAGAEIDAIVETLEMADDSTSSYLDVETGKVHSTTAEELSFAENPRKPQKDLPAWQCASVELRQIATEWCEEHGISFR